MDDTDELEEVNLVKPDDDAVTWLHETAGCSVDHAKRALRQTGGDISDAIDFLPTLQAKSSSSTEQEIRKLIDTADATTSSSDATMSSSNATTSSSDATTSSSDATVDATTSSSVNSPITDNDNVVELPDVIRKLNISDDDFYDDITITKNDVIMKKDDRRRAGEQLTERGSTESNLGPKELLLLCWNVDGLCHMARSERFSAVISEIKTLKPHLVMLQEVVDEHVAELKSLRQSYDLTIGDRSSGYFNIILVTKQVGNVKIIDKNVIKFPYSTMGRHLVLVMCELYGRQFTLCTSHLESLKDYSLERTDQLNKVFEHILEEGRPGISMFGGDTNLRDWEMKRIKYTDQFYDVWEMLGSDASTCYTWDTSVNTNLGVSYSSRLRFDRIFMRYTPLCTPTSLELVGERRLLSCDMFPSDHWGLLARFNITSHVA